MYLHLPPLSPLHFHSKKSPSPSSSRSLALLFQTFEESLLHHLKSLVPRPDDAGGQAAVSFSYLSRAVGVLSSTHALAGALASDPSLSGSDEAALSSYIDSSIKLLDACNAVSAEVERLSRGRLLLLFVVHLLSSSSGDPPPAEKIIKARESIREWEGIPKCGISPAAAGLIRSLSPRGAPPRGKTTALGRAIYAVEAVSALISGVVFASLGGEVDLAAGSGKISGEFAWGEAFNGLRASVSSEIFRRSPGETESVEACVRRLAEVIDDAAVYDGERTESLRSTVKEVEKSTEELTDGLERLGSAVNGLFRAAMSTRNTVLHRFRVGPQKCK